MNTIDALLILSTVWVSGSVDSKGLKLFLGALYLAVAVLLFIWSAL